MQRTIPVPVLPEHPEVRLERLSGAGLPPWDFTLRSSQEFEAKVRITLWKQDEVTG